LISADKETGAHLFGDDTLSSRCTVRTVIGFYHVEDIVHGVRDELSWGVGKRYRVLLQFLAKLGDREDPVYQVRPR
jgi:hypothetical protein